MRLTESQEAVAAHLDGPARVVGSYVTGRTTALRVRAGRLAESAGPDRVLVLCRSAVAARSFAGQPAPAAAAAATNRSAMATAMVDGLEPTTFWGLALGILERSGRTRRLLDTEEQRAYVSDVLCDGTDRWPRLAPAAGDEALLVEIADAVCHYQASWLGLEELRTHADAAGVLEPWEQLADLTRRYREALAADGCVDWAGALVEAGLALRDPARVEAERARFDHVIVDDFEQTSFAAHRLLASLVAPGGNIAVAGNLDAPVSSRFAADRRWLERFPRSYGARLEVDLNGRLAPEAGPAVDVARADRVITELAAFHQAGEPWSAVAVVAASESGAQALVTELEAAGIPVVRESDDLWELGPAVSTDAVAVVSPTAAAGRTWPLVVAIGCRDEELVRRPPAHPHLLDVALLAGPDVPSAEERVARWKIEQRRAAALVGSRATRRLVRLSAGS